MGSTLRREDADLIDGLRRHPARFGFFQAVRLLTNESVPRRERKQRRSTGDELEEALQTLRFRSLPSLGFPPAPIDEIRTERDGREDLLVSFMGLTGPMGVLPHHYTELLIKRIFLKDESLRDFLDILHQRSVALFYRAWAKYRFPVQAERGLRGGEEDVVSRSVFSLVGLGTRGLRERATSSDDAWAYFSGLLSNHVRSSVGLATLLTEALGFPARIEEMVGQWLELPAGSISRLSSAPGVNNSLGRTLSLGSRVWDVQSKVRIHLGPLHFAEYEMIRKGTRGYRSLCDLVRSYVGSDLDFDFRITLRSEETPMLRMTAREGAGAALGRTGWLRSSVEQPLPPSGSILLGGAA